MIILQNISFTFSPMAKWICVYTYFLPQTASYFNENMTLIAKGSKCIHKFSYVITTLRWIILYILCFHLLIRYQFIECQRKGTHSTREWVISLLTGFGFSNNLRLMFVFVWDVKRPLSVMNVSTSFHKTIYSFLQTVCQQEKTLLVIIIIKIVCQSSIWNKTHKLIDLLINRTIDTGPISVLGTAMKRTCTLSTQDYFYLHFKFDLLSNQGKDNTIIMGILYITW